MDHEIEAKFRVADFDGLRRRLVAAGGRFQGSFLQTDRYFDAVGNDLRKSDCGLRIRTFRVEEAPDGGVSQDTRPQLTFKGPRQGHADLKIREELQTHVDDAEMLCRILRGLGLHLNLLVEKRRATYHLDACVVELDELPVIGRFVEIEAPRSEQIATVCDRLELAYEPLTDSYLHLLEEACESMAAETCQQITFAGCAPCPRRR